MCSEFKNQGYETYGAQDLKELECIQRNEKCDVIVADHILADGNFFDYYDTLKFSQKKEIPVAILLMNSNEELSPEVVFAMGAYAVFQKPFKIKDMYDAVENATFSKREGLMRRNDERVVLICRLEYKLKRESHWQFAFSNNISFGGFFAVTSEHIPAVGNEISFKLKFSDKQIVEGFAKVIWTRKTPKRGEQMGFGVQFSEERENYVNLLVPIINEARTRQNETAIFQEENIISLLEESIQLAKIKIAKSKTQFSFYPRFKEAFIMCRFPQMLHALTELIYHIGLPLHDVDGSECIFELQKKITKIHLKITVKPGGTS